MTAAGAFVRFNFANMRTTSVRNDDVVRPAGLPKASVSLPFSFGQRYFCRADQPAPPPCITAQFARRSSEAGSNSSTGLPSGSCT